MVLSVGTAGHPLDGDGGGGGRVARRSRRRGRGGGRRRRNSLDAVAVGADGEAALAARPVNVEQRRVTRVTHLAHALDRSFPHSLRPS